MQQEVLLVGIKLDELLAKIEIVVENKLRCASDLHGQKSNKTNYVTRAEVAKLLKISLPTLHDWTKLKLLQSYKIGNRVLYKLEEVEQALKQSPNFKYKRQ